MSDYYWKLRVQKGYDPSQPRVPAGSPDGGRWTAGGGTGASVTFGDVTKTQRFKDWFGDSKVVDEDGNPKVVYHGTKADFEALSPEKIDTPRFGWGFYFSDDPATAHNMGEGGRTIPVYLSIKNPYEVPEGVVEFEYEGYPGKWREQARAWTRDMQKKGYDGVVWRRADGVNWWVAFEPNQAKSIFNPAIFGPGPELLKEF